ncbi:hypothetical protein [Andreprevotia chitinilytica]|uniref:hypothetical protein n=1 Tax=Andreprevotia chitinilytica TaxID=396808 RepID=UPI000556688B|nr:hypothetical protein [Andreprevotia chitinilytica]
MRRWFAILILFSTVALADRIDVLPLKHKLAEELAPALQQAFPEAVIQAFKGQMIVRAPDDATFKRIVALAAQLDTRTQSLIVTVEQREAATSSSSDIDANGRAVISNRGVDGELAISADARESQRSSNASQQVTTIDGGRAMISLGQSRFYPTLSVAFRPGYAIVTRGGVWQSAETGFWVEPQLLGDLVRLRLYPRSSSFNRNGSINERSVYSEVSGRVGEWLPVGQSNQSASTSSDGTLSSSRSNGSQSYTVWVKVDPQPGQ